MPTLTYSIIDNTITWFLKPIKIRIAKSSRKHSSKIYKWPTRIWRHSTSLDLREIQIKTTVKNELPPHIQQSWLSKKYSQLHTLVKLGRFCIPVFLERRWWYFPKTVKTRVIIWPRNSMPIYAYKIIYMSTTSTYWCL